MTNKTELLPCPFCARNVRSVTFAGKRWVDRGHGSHCPLQGISLPADKWNTRASPPEDVRAGVDEPVAYMRKADGPHDNLVKCTFTCPGAFGVHRHTQRQPLPAIDFNEEILIERPEGVRPKFCGDVKLSFDAAEYRGRAWLADVDRDDMIQVEGPDNCRKVGEALIAWAEAWEDKP